MMANGDPEGRVFLFYPHTKNGFCFLRDDICMSMSLSFDVESDGTGAL